ncbi:MAG: porin [Gloeotrichia echinulata IR180]
MHTIKIISCALLSIAFGSLSYASEGVELVSAEEPVIPEVLQQRSPVSTQAKDLQTEAPLVVTSETAKKIVQQPSPASTPTKVESDRPLSPLQQPPTQLHNLETANQLPKGAFQAEAGWLQVLPTDDSVSGTGLETYQLSFDWGVTDNLQIGFTGDIFDDYIRCSVRSECVDFTTVSYGTKLKYRLINENRWSVGVAGTAQLLNVSGNGKIFNNSPNKSFLAVNPVGALHFPTTYKASPSLQLHFTPGVVFFPDKIEGGDFFGTFFNIGTGFSWQTTKRVNLFANIQAPLGPGGNAYSSKDASIYRKLLWTFGVDYALNPRMAAELYATNSYGATPTTGLLAFIPDGNDLLLGIRFKHVFDFGQGYAANFTDSPQAPLSDRDRTLLFDGLTLASANTLQTSKFQVRGGLQTHGGSSFALAYGLTNDAQFELIVDQFASSGRFSIQDISGPGVKIGGAIKLKFLDQARGDLVTLGFKLAGISDTALQGGGIVGSVYTELPITYQFSPQTAIFMNPKGGFFGKTTRSGVGIGINQAIGDKLQLIGEFTPIFEGKTGIWSTGLRYLPNSGLGFDLFAGNAIGRSGLGTVTADPAGTNVGFSINWGI